MSTIVIVLAGAVAFVLAISAIASRGHGVSLWVTLAVFAVVVLACWAAIGWMKGGA